MKRVYTNPLKAILISIAMFIMITILASCRPANIVSNNISKEADEFKVTRKITVVNMRTDNVMFEITGTFSLQNTSSRELAIVCMVGPDLYKKHFVYLNDWTSYVMEDISGADVDPYHYEITIYPFMLQPKIEVDLH